MARFIALLAFSSAALVAAETTTVDLFLSFLSPDDIVVSVVDVDATATTYEIRYMSDGYPGSWEDSDSGYGSTAQTIIQGPETVSMAYSYSDTYEDYGSYTQDLACNVHREEDAITCTISNHQEYDNKEIDTVTTVSTTDLDFLYYPVTVVGGAEKLDATPGPSVTETGSSASATGEFSAPLRPSASGASSAPSHGSNSTATVTVSSSALPSGTEVPKTDNAAAAAVPQNAILAGVAAVFGGALML
ncbi:Fc.00g088510.m01.CDS01 [Cosmosporella sp. VM-42]